MIYIMSEDRFFAEGVISQFSTIDQKIVSLPFSPDHYLETAKQITCGDTLLLAIEYLDIVGDFIQHLTNRAVRICLFLDYPGKYYHLTFKANGIIPRNIDRQYLLPAISQTLKNGGLTHLGNKLTPAERHIMDKLSKGIRPHRVAKELNISVKTVCAHKKKGLERIGLPPMNCKSLVIYYCANTARLRQAAVMPAPFIN
jgi:hypothetical protein